MQGIICMWPGLLVDIPNGWALCDGTNGTPDLRGKFVRGAADGIDPGNIGGTIDHRHYVAGTTGSRSIAHTHLIDGDTNDPPYDSSGHTPVAGNKVAYQFHTHPIYFTSESGDSNHDHAYFGYSGYANNLPPYYTLAFIMKL